MKPHLQKIELFCLFLWSPGVSVWTPPTLVRQLPPGAPATEEGLVGAGFAAAGPLGVATPVETVSEHRVTPLGTAPCGNRGLLSRAAKAGIP